MKLLIVYASTEGQTEKIAHFLLNWLVDAGHAAAVVPASVARTEMLAGYDRVIVAGSVHAGRYQKELRAWARHAAEALGALPSLFVSVSLAAAGTDADDWKGLEAGVQRFVEETGWRPGRIVHVAGAFKFSEYDFFRYWAMRWIAAQKDETVRPGEDREYTDWAALRALLEAWTAEDVSGHATGPMLVSDQAHGA